MPLQSWCGFLLATFTLSPIPAKTFQSPQPAPGPTQLIARYRGMLPCADCSGIDTELALYAKSPNEAVNTRYVLKRTYMKGRGQGKSFAESGTWTLLRGTPENPDATIYQLQDGKTANLTNFLKVGASQLEQLDKNQRRIDSKLNFKLTKVGSSSLANPARRIAWPRVARWIFGKERMGSTASACFQTGKNATSGNCTRDSVRPRSRLESQNPRLTSASIVHLRSVWRCFSA